MAARGFFAHNSPNSYVFWVGIEQHYSSSGYSDWEVGENLVWAAPEFGAKRAVRIWMQRPPHRANLLNPRWRQIGLAAVSSSSAPEPAGTSPPPSSRPTSAAAAKAGKGPSPLRLAPVTGYCKLTATGERLLVVVPFSRAAKPL